MYLMLCIIPNKLFQDDVKLIVSNCLKYNGPDTVYYSAGKKLLSAAQSILSRDKLTALRKEIPSISVLSADMVRLSLLYMLVLFFTRFLYCLLEGGWLYLYSFICLSAGVVEWQPYCFVIILCSIHIQRWHQY